VARALLAAVLVASFVAWFGVLMAAVGAPGLVALAVAAAVGVAAAVLVRRELGWVAARRRVRLARRAGGAIADVEVYRDAEADVVYTAVTITWSDGSRSAAVVASPRACPRCGYSSIKSSADERAQMSRGRPDRAWRGGLARAALTVAASFVVGLVMAAMGAPSWPTMLVAFAGGVVVARVVDDSRRDRARREPGVSR
jgi:hypothetical protein